MGSKILPVVTVLGLCACSGLREPAFIETWEPAFCAAYVTCASDEMLRAVNVRECLEHLRIQNYPEPPDCVYDARQAELCAAAMSDDSEPFTCKQNDPVLPEACGKVYSGCPIPRVPPERVVPGSL